jgi:hypothetical protein
MMFGRYRVSGELGRGAMGTVYRAVDPLIEREVAIKTLLPDLPEDVMGDVRARFLREAKSAGRLNHPNIVTIFDVGEQDGVAYIAMELLEGRSLQQILRDPERLPFAKIADLVAQVAEGLDHAQGFKIVHRDVKPANIVVSPAGRAKLTDFGVAHVPSSSMTQTGQALGSPKYMSPEQVLGLAIDPRSDIFSLGVVLYEMLTRKTPFEKAGDTNIYALLHRIAGEPHKPPSEADPTIPRAFDEVLRRALAKKPEDRYQRAGEMAAALRQIAGISAAAAAPAPGAGGTEFEKTVKLSTTGSAALPEAAHSQLIDDVETFARNFEKEEQARLRAEEEARARKEAEVHRWAEAEAKRREEYERQKEASTPGGQTGGKRTAAIELLKKKAAERAVSDDRVKRAEIVARVDERLRAAFQYLSEFTVNLNEANPVSDAPYGVMYLGEVPRASLSEGFTDYRSREIDGKNRYDFVTFKYKVTSIKPVTFTLVGKDMENFRERLDRLKIKYALEEKKNDFGQVDRAAFTLSGPFPCGAIIRGDYDKGGFMLGVENVRRYGARQFRLGLDQLTDELLDEFGTYVLGADDAFEKRLGKS